MPLTANELTIQILASIKTIAFITPTRGERLQAAREQSSSKVL